ncbi:9552_t:CDS:2, partial [Racocetra persica]
GLSQKKLAEILEITQQTIIRWKKDKDPFRKRKRKPKDYGIIPELLRSYIIDEDNKYTQNELADLVSKETGQQITQKKVSYILRKRLNYTYKKLTYHYTQLDEEKAKTFNGEIKPLLETNPFIAIDECSFYPNLNPRFGYSLKGERAVSKRPSHKGKHYTLLFAVSNLKKNGEIKPIGNKRNYLIMDNARIHTAFGKRKEAGLPSVEEQMLKKNIEVRFITKYAPMLNPVELCFNFLRQRTERSRSRNYEEMRLAIEKAVKLLNKKKLITKIIPTIQPRFFATINKEELELLKQMEITVNKSINERNNLMLDLLFYTGLRINELRNIRHCDYQAGSLRILGKGNKVRYVFLPPFLVKYFNPYSRNYLFTTKRQPKISNTQARTIIYQKVKKAGMIKKISPHTFRRSFATILNNKNVRLTTIQKLLGHSQIATTSTYIHNSYEELYKDYSKLWIKDELYKSEDARELLDQNTDIIMDEAIPNPKGKDKTNLKYLDDEDIFEGNNKLPVPRWAEEICLINEDYRRSERKNKRLLDNQGIKELVKEYLEDINSNILRFADFE